MLYISNAHKLFNFSYYFRNSTKINTIVKMSSPFKPPNVLIYSEEKYFKTIASQLYKCLHSDKYVIYPLKQNQVFTTPWKDNVALLVVVSDNLSENISKEFLHYLTSGEKLFVVCSNFNIANVCEVEEMKETRVKVKCGDIEEKLLRAKYLYSIQNSSVLATDSEDKNVILKANKENGVLITSSVNVIFDSVDEELTKESCQSVNYSDKCLPILKNLLTSHFNLEGYVGDQPKPSSGYVIVENETKLEELMKKLSITEIPLEKSLKIPSEIHQTSVLKVPLVTKHDDLKASLFDKDRYFKSLKSDCFGRMVVFFPVVTSTMYPAEYLSDHPGAVVIANRQLTGKGRGDNVWISPEGCAAFTLHFPLMLSSKLGQRLSIMQHMASLAFVHGIRKQPGYENIDFRLKWPNDIYFEKDKKIGGVLVNTTIQGDVVHVFAGIGVNVSNQRPTLCVNSIIESHNVESGMSLPGLSIEEVIAVTLTELERLVHNFTNQGPASFLKLYYTYWIHKDQQVVLSDTKIKASVHSIDDYGFLVVQTEDGKKLSLQPDGNRFDMMKNLIISKELS